MDLILALLLNMIFHYQVNPQIYKKSELIIDHLTDSDNPLYKFYPYLVFLHTKIFIIIIIIIPFKNLKLQNNIMLGALTNIGKAILPGAM